MKKKGRDPHQYYSKEAEDSPARGYTNALPDEAGVTFPSSVTGDLIIVSGSSWLGRVSENGEYHRFRPDYRSPPATSLFEFHMRLQRATPR
ncbi:hypothetical protein LTR35_015286 [Friedmanniomyces endolithicus]|uniref:Uncharacterized protein n=1 Tax=Friedmanniomyces endolithicus TaxID=329885 RepID=A0AAN6FBA4_9PEZI|nr:hypothetical protein LTR35_015286 [Friedmanniomyces endolithicus]KAK0289244.1 hypothetical protein LTS00_009163 [Friedmanniomyces endolithicus]KAK0309588.1 hypothetical protein LTR82_015076 [Friedmanniomyces endolithicus]KAK0982743.1 hypothetical protein LTR54_014612 [Friedmanniomyces endolithicus]